jgi:hypothetical protein
MKRVILHWTAGTHIANDMERERYHYLVQGNGRVVDGKWSPEANLNPVKGRYAAHTLNANTGSIGVSLCCMGGAKESPFNAGQWPMTIEQWERAIVLIADLCAKYKIPVTPQTVLTHAEVGANLGKPQRGKWDITRLAFDPTVVGAKAVGDKLRREVQSELPTAKPNEPLTRERKPVLKHRFVQSTLGSLSGGAGILGVFTGWDWRAMAVMAVFALIVGGFLWYVYRDEIRKGLFSPEEE